MLGLIMVTPCHLGLQVDHVNSAFASRFYALLRFVKASHTPKKIIRDGSSLFKPISKEVLL
jgi:hypothetical protein